VSTCPIPLQDYPSVLMAHGGGGRLSRRLVEEIFLPAFGTGSGAALHDGAVFALRDVRLALSTDSYVVSPIFFPGGDIGSLAIHGTVNDLAMCGAQPVALSAAFIVEEGFPMESLWRIAQSAARAAAAVGVGVLTGDTKVVERGKGDGVFINTTGVGLVPDGVDIDASRARPGDAVVVSGPLADHGMAIMSVREGLEFGGSIESDSAPLWGMVQALLTALGPHVHVLRDPTRGGVASALNEIALSAGLGIVLEEHAIPVRPAVRAACEVLGLDPLYVANEGKLLAIVPANESERVVETLRRNPRGGEAVRIGTVTADHPGRVLLRTRVGGSRVVDMLAGEQLPRIC
jgi:hydrogenase expression/formation protein HypE